MSWELNTCPRDSKQGGIQQRDIKKERKAICLPLFFLVPQNSFTGLRETSPVLSTMLAPTWVLACFSGQGQQHLSCEKMFSLQYVCLTELCPTAPGVGPQSTGLLGSPAGGWGARVGWSNRAFVLATCFGRVRCHWEDYGTVVRSPDREGRRGKQFSQGTRVSPGGSPHVGALIPCSLLTPSVPASGRSPSGPVSL